MNSTKLPFDKSIAIVGATGKMGKKISELLEVKPWIDHFRHTLPIDSKTLPSEFTEAPTVAIDFSSPASTIEWAKRWAELKVPVLVGTTGFKKEEFESLQEILQNNAWSLIPNTSLGIYAFIKSIRAFVKFLSDIEVIEIHEVHHIHKKDSPSGTALLVKAALIDAGFEGDITIRSAREGEVVGTHTVVLKRQHDRLIITHEARDRAVFADGALKLAQKLADKPPRAKPYTFDELLAQ